ncbi:hypothetical protein COCNU_05G010870 [Cocos nucifera]|uniref:peptidylprolyl isomerase n=1 Tax=Cocos nucifera TaxID=13894 RepID=A0A8K0I9L4_COCNU|nr:hypothetical protein COCNU_05G010870 [Cocos nucifera]
MFTQQKKGWAGWSPSPRVGDGPDGGSAPVNARSAGGLSLGKGKGKGKSVVGALPPPPLQASLGENGSDAAGGVGDVEVWRRFREAGLLDESVLQKKEKEALVQRISELETEASELRNAFSCLLRVMSSKKGQRSHRKMVWLWNPVIKKRNRNAGMRWVCRKARVPLEKARKMGKTMKKFISPQRRVIHLKTRWLPGIQLGKVPLEWYKDEEHIGYDITGKKIRKQARKDKIDSFLARVDDSKNWDVEKEEEIVLPNGIRYYEIRMGGGTAPRTGDLVVIDLQERVERSGEAFVDAFVEGKRTLALVMGSRPYTKGMCKGVEYVLRTMRAGGKRRVIVPPSLGFGDEDADLGLGIRIPPAARLDYVRQVDKVSMAPS